MSKRPDYPKIMYGIPGTDCFLNESFHETVHAILECEDLEHGTHFPETVEVATYHVDEPQVQDIADAALDHVLEWLTENFTHEESSYFPAEATDHNRAAARVFAGKVLEEFIPSLYYECEKEREVVYIADWFQLPPNRSLAKSWNVQIKDGRAFMEKDGRGDFLSKEELSHE